MDLGRSRLNSKIAWEKMMSKNSIPQIRFQGFDSWWETIKLTDLGISVGGTAIESEFDPDGKYKVISIGSYSEESKYKDQGIRAIYSKKTEKRILEKDDLTMILNDKTSTGKIIGRVLLIDEDNSYVYNQRTQRICLDKNKYVPDFIFQLLNADTNRNKIVRSAQGNTQIYVNWSDISNLDYLIPDSFDEQSAIGSLFRNLDDLLASYKDNLANYQSLKTTMLAKMFPKAGQTVPEIRLAGFVGEWERNSLSDVCNINSGRDYKHLKDGDIPVYGTGGYMLSVNEKLSDENAIGIGRKGTIDKPYLLLAPFWTVDTLFYVTCKVGYDLNYLFLIFQKVRWKKFDESTGVPSLSKKTIEKVVSKFPSLPEQQAIGKYFTNLDNLINTYQEKISQLETLKKKLLQDMFV